MVGDGMFFSSFFTFFFNTNPSLTGVPEENNFFQDILNLKGCRVEGLFSSGKGKRYEEWAEFWDSVYPRVTDV